MNVMINTTILYLVIQTIEGISAIEYALTEPNKALLVQFVRRQVDGMSLFYRLGAYGLSIVYRLVLAIFPKPLCLALLKFPPFSLLVRLVRGMTFLRVFELSTKANS